MKDDLTSDARAIETQRELLSLLDQIEALVGEVRERVRNGAEDDG